MALIAVTCQIVQYYGKFTVDNSVLKWPGGIGVSKNVIQYIVYFCICKARTYGDSLKFIRFRN